MIAGWGDDQVSPARVGHQTKRREVLEYYDGVNSTTILGELFGQKKPQRFVKITVNESSPFEQGQIEDAESMNRDFLRRRGAFNLPPKPTWYVSFVYIMSFE